MATKVKQGDRLIYALEDAGGALPDYRVNLCPPVSDPPDINEDVYLVGDDGDFPVDFAQKLVDRGICKVYSAPIQKKESTAVEKPAEKQDKAEPGQAENS